MRLQYLPESHLPPLAWLARCDSENAIIKIHHGHDVETHDHWFCEATWNGEFKRGDFDQTDVIFGSGGRMRNGQLTLVSSSSTCDRLQSICIEGTYYISNSLVCLAAVLDLHFDPWYPYYYEDLSSITFGIDDYKHELDCDKGTIELTYCRNLRWDGATLSRIDKPFSTGSFANFEDYREYLLTALREMRNNMQADTRRLRFDTISTCSTGYDSLVVTVLARETGTTEAICVPQDRLDLSDSGVELIRQLDMQPMVIDRYAWREQALSETPFIASDACGRDVWLQPAFESLHGRALLTGNYGDSAWLDTPPLDNSPFQRSLSTGPSGLSLGEFRLLAGFIHCPLPYIGALAITASPLIGSEQMQAWRLGNHYDRPIPRRIVEEAGISRNLFGMRKTATAVHLFRQVDFERFFKGTDSLRDYMRWIRRRSRENPPPANDIYQLTTPPLERVEIPLFRQLFPWAIEHCKQANYAGVNLTHVKKAEINE